MLLPAIAADKDDAKDKVKDKDVSAGENDKDDGSKGDISEYN